MDVEDYAWVVEQFGIAFVVGVHDRSPSMEPTDGSRAGAYDLAHLFRDENEPRLARDVLGAIDDVLAGKPVRLNDTGRPVLFESEGQAYLHLDYSEVVIGRHSYEVWSHSSVGEPEVDAQGSTPNLRRLLRTWCDFVEEQWPLHEAYQAL